MGCNSLTVLPTVPRISYSRLVALAMNLAKISGSSIWFFSAVSWKQYVCKRDISIEAEESGDESLG